MPGAVDDDKLIQRPGFLIKPVGVLNGDIGIHIAVDNQQRPGRDGVSA